MYDLIIQNTIEIYDLVSELNNIYSICTNNQNTIKNTTKILKGKTSLTPNQFYKIIYHMYILKKNEKSLNFQLEKTLIDFNETYHQLIEKSNEN